jgi:predicted phosphohydrolase
MPIFTIADLHLSTNEETNKPMDKFGSRWTGYQEKITEAWTKTVSDGDTVVLPGDISWGISFDESLPDFKFIDALPGKKLIGKGNHDYWWTSVSKMKKILADNGITTIDFMQNNAFFIDNIALTGTRGWFYEESKNAPAGTDFDKLINREAGRLELGLRECEKKEHERKVVFLHFPPVFREYICRPIVDMLHKYKVTEVYAGHIHGQYTIPPVRQFEGIKITLISADYINFKPFRIET